jgi:hypothetical protein
MASSPSPLALPSLGRRLLALVAGRRRDPPEQEVVALRGRYQMIVNRQTQQDSVALVASDGAVRFRIVITDSGPEITVEAKTLSLHTSGTLAIDADRIHLHGREGVAVTAGGGVHIEANQNVRINGERIYLNG